MQSAETVLKVLHDRGQRGLPVQQLFRQLTNPDLYRRAYARLYRNDGALTPGSTPETVDGMTLAKIEAIIAAVRQERYRWRPVRRVLIEKRHSTKKRPRGLPSWSDKLLQEVVRSLLNAYYEPQFRQFSHGFRPGRGCHTALTAIHETWKGTVWFIEGDIAACFSSLDHDILLATLAEKIHDHRFLRLVAQLLKAGYLEDWRYHPRRVVSPKARGPVRSSPTSICTAWTSSSRQSSCPSTTGEPDGKGPILGTSPAAIPLEAGLSRALRPGRGAGGEPAGDPPAAWQEDR